MLEIEPTRFLPAVFWPGRSNLSHYQSLSHLFELGDKFCFTRDVLYDVPYYPRMEFSHKERVERKASARSPLPLPGLVSLGASQRGTEKYERRVGRMEKRSYFPRIPEAAGLSRRHSSYVDSILTDIAGNPVRRVRHTTGPFCKTANTAIRRLFSLAYPQPPCARSCRLFAIEATFAGGTVPLGGHAACNAAECRKWNYAKSRGGTMRAETMHEDGEGSKAARRP